VRKIGPDLVISRLWKELGIDAALRKQLQSRHYEFDVRRAVYLTVLHACSRPAVTAPPNGGARRTDCPAPSLLELQHLAGAMAFLGEPLDEEPAEIAVPGAPAARKIGVEEALFEPRRNLFSELDLVFFDALPFTSRARRRTHRPVRQGKDHRPDLKQMVVAWFSTCRGRPICCELWPATPPTWRP
jgi:hypothetical protein